MMTSFDDRHRSIAGRWTGDDALVGLRLHNRFRFCPLWAIRLMQHGTDVIDDVLMVHISEAMLFTIDFNRTVPEWMFFEDKVDSVYVGNQQRCRKIVNYRRTCFIHTDVTLYLGYPFRRYDYHFGIGSLSLSLSLSIYIYIYRYERWQCIAPRKSPRSSDWIISNIFFHYRLTAVFSAVSNMEL